jgi:transcriptional/translational regulatory protein YebC/TACO1
MISEEALFEKAINVGAEDLKRDGDEFTIFTAYEDFLAVKEGLEKAGVALKESTIARVAKTLVKITAPEMTRQILELMEALEDHDDVQNVWSNFDIDENILMSF